MPKRRRLGDLYVLGRELKISDGNDDEGVDVWLQKLNPLEHEKALRAASAAKAVVLIGRNDENSELWREAYADVCEFGARDQLIDYAVSEEAQKVRESREAEIAAEDEWEKDNYLQGLTDAWENGGVKERWVEDHDDPEAARVYKEIERFANLVNDAAQREIASLRKDFEEMDLEKLRRIVVQKILDLRSGLQWVREFRRWEVFYATRLPEDHGGYYFVDIEEVNALDARVFGQLSVAIQELSVDISEGKSLPATPTSSPQSGPSGEAGTQEPSSPAASDT